MVIKKIYVNSWYMAMISAMTLAWVITLFLLSMWYNKRAVRVANTDYVREVTKWPGHTVVHNYPVEYELLLFNIPFWSITKNKFTSNIM